ncbi:hypothetical protein [Enterococcus olivae]
MEKKVILLACTTGVSATFFLKYMQQAAQIKQMQLELVTCGILELETYLAMRKIDILLLAPHARPTKNYSYQKIANLSVDLDIIKMTDYGLMDGERVLTQIEDLLV